MTVYGISQGIHHIADETGVFPDYEDFPLVQTSFVAVFSPIPNLAKVVSVNFWPLHHRACASLRSNPKKLYEGATGRSGFIQVCFDIRDMEALGKYCAEWDILHGRHHPTIQEGDSLI